MSDPTCDVSKTLAAIDHCISLLQQALKQSRKAYDFKFLVVLDFEATCDDDKAFKQQEIIEWPAMVIDIKQKEIYSDPKDYFHVYVKPTHNAKLTNFCTTLTGITQTMVDNGVDIEQALDSWNKWCYKHDLLPTAGSTAPRAAIVTCGDWDLEQMWTKQCKLSGFNYTKPAVLFSAWINVKKVCQRILKLERARGMMGMLKLLNIPHVGRHHSGIDDVRNICNIVLELLDRDDKLLFFNFTKHNKSKDIQKGRSFVDDAVFARHMDRFHK